MPATTAPVSDPKPATGVAALLNAMGLIAIQVSPEIVALQTARPGLKG